MKSINWVKNQLPKPNDSKINLMSMENTQKAKKFHEGFPQYKETPLVRLENLSDELGVADIFVKDESFRFGLNAFKVLGGSYAIGSYIAEKLNCDISELNYEKLTSDKLKKELGDITFYTATDGNHGRGVAWSANKLNQSSVVFMPKGTSKIRLENIKKLGAKATIEQVNYDDCVRLAMAASEKDKNGVVVQDTAWEGYEDIPNSIMQGYGTMAYEAHEQLKRYGCDRPTHIFIQAGVGSLAGAVQGFFAEAFKENCPITTIVEAQKADCIYRSALKQDGNAYSVTGDMNTIMAGLACGEPNIVSWSILKEKSSFFTSCSDSVSALGMRILGAPLKGDNQVISGESGAVTMGVLYSIMKSPELKQFKEELKLDKNSKILLFSTEGDTDPENYREIVWQGKQV